MSDKKIYTANDLLLFLDKIGWALEEDRPMKAFKILMDYKTRLVKIRDDIK